MVVNFSALPSRFKTYLSYPARVGYDETRRRRLIAHDELDASLGCVVGQQVAHHLADAVEVHGDALEQQLVAFYLVEVEDVIDDGEQRLTGRADDLGVLVLLGT